MFRIKEAVVTDFATANFGLYLSILRGWRMRWKRYRIDDPGLKTSLVCPTWTSCYRFQKFLCRYVKPWSRCLMRRASIYISLYPSFMRRDAQKHMVRHDTSKHQNSLNLDNPEEQREPAQLRRPRLKGSWTETTGKRRCELSFRLVFLKAPPNFSCVYTLNM